MPKPLACLTEEHAAAVMSGRCSISELASSLGVTRQALHKAFRKRGWSTKPKSAPGAPPGGLGGPQSHVSAQAAAGVAARLPGAPGGPGGAPSTHGIGIVFPNRDADADFDAFVDAIRLQVANTSLLALVQISDLLAAGQMGAHAIKAAMAAIGLAIDHLAVAGYGLQLERDAAPMRVVFQEMTAAEVEEARARAEAEYRGVLGLDD